MGKYIGLMGVGGDDWGSVGVSKDEWGWVHCLIMPKTTALKCSGRRRIYDVVVFASNI